jgi:glycosyltransferase involved in cell wall biosynthesis
VAGRLRLLASAALNNRLERECLARADAITCDSEYARQRVAAIHGGPVASRMRVVPGWVDTRRFVVVEDRAAAKALLGWPLDRPVLFCLRRLVPRMGLDRLLEAVAIARHAGARFHLVLAGQGPLREALDARARALGVADGVMMAGRADETLLPMMYGAADAFVLPSAELECFGLVALESLACGRPVLASPVAAVPELVGAIEPRWLARDAGAEAIAVLLTDYVAGKLPAHAPSALRSFAEERFAQNACLQTLVAAALGEGPEA